MSWLKSTQSDRVLADGNARSIVSAIWELVVAKESLVGVLAIGVVSIGKDVDVVNVGGVGVGSFVVYVDCGLSSRNGHIDSVTGSAENQICGFSTSGFWWG